ncbi:MAG: hypothetical protein HYU64_07495 [Armatimonadetes bacterium]|nr:hypothetical protein [Armatimonadota bacterium]
MLGSLCKNVLVDTSSSNSWITFTPGLKDLAEVFAKTLQVFGACRILFGTDSTYFPRGWRKDVFDSQLLCLKKLLTPGNDIGLIFGENLARLHSLKSLQLR